MIERHGAVSRKGSSSMAEMPSIVLRGVDKEYRRDEFRIPVLVGPRPDRRRGGVPRPDGPVGLGQDDALEPDRRARPGDQRPGRSSTAKTWASSREAQITRWRANNVGFIFQTYNLIPVLTALRKRRAAALAHPSLAAAGGARTS